MKKDDVWKSRATGEKIVLTEEVGDGSWWGKIVSNMDNLNIKIFEEDLHLFYDMEKK